MDPRLLCERLLYHLMFKFLLKLVRLIKKFNGEIIYCLPFIFILIMLELVADFVSLLARECDSIQLKHIFLNIVS